MNCFHWTTTTEPPIPRARLSSELKNEFIYLLTTVCEVHRVGDGVTSVYTKGHQHVGGGVGDEHLGEESRWLNTTGTSTETEKSFGAQISIWKE